MQVFAILNGERTDKKYTGSKSVINYSSRRKNLKRIIKGLTCPLGS